MIENDTKNCRIIKSVKLGSQLLALRQVCLYYTLVIYQCRYLFYKPHSSFSCRRIPRYFTLEVVHIMIGNGSNIWPVAE